MYRTLSKLLPLLLASWILGLQPLYCQSSSSIDFTCVTWRSLNIGDIYYGNPDKPERLKPTKGTRSELYSLKGESEFRLYTRSELDGETIYKLVGRAAIPPESSRILFLIHKSPKGDGLPLRILGIDDSPNKFPAGTFEFVNFSPSPLQATLQGDSHTIKPSGVTLIKPDIPKDGGLVPFLLKSGDTTVYETRLFGQSNSRKTIFIYPSNGKRPVIIKFLSQSMNAKAETGENSADR